MQIVSFASLFQTDVNISDISCVERQWKNRWENIYPSGRDQNVLSFTAGGSKQLFLPGREEPLFEVSAPSAFLISQDSPYISRSAVSAQGELGRTVCIKFKITDHAGEAILIKERYLCWENLGEVFCRLFGKAIDAYLNANVSRFALKSIIFQLLSELENLSLTRQRTHRGFRDLLPALHLIENNLSDQTSVEELAKMCAMSTSYFGKRFKEYSGGICLTDYRNRLRIQKASELMDSSLWSLKMISDVLGFYDTSHFYKVYKKFKGEYPKNLKNSE